MVEYEVEQCATLVYRCLSLYLYIFYLHMCYFLYYLVNESFRVRQICVV